MHSEDSETLQNQFEQAVLDQDINKLQKVLANKSGDMLLNVNQTDAYGDTALAYSVRLGHTGIVKALIEAGADVNYVNQADAYGDTALMVAGSRGYIKIVEDLITAGADVNYVNQGTTALVEAARLGRTEIVEALIAAGADVNRATKHGETALICAARLGHTEMLRALIEAGADVNDVNQVDRYGATALMIAVSRGYIEIVEDLITAGADVNYVNHADAYGTTALMDAVQLGRTETVKALIEAKADVNRATKHGDTALMYAARRGHTEIVKALIAAKANVNQPGVYGDTALMNAATGGHTEILQILLKAGADVNDVSQADVYGATALMNAAREGHTETLQILLKAGADVNYVNQPSVYGATALMGAAIRGHTEMVEALLAAGADVNKANANRLTSSMLATELRLTSSTPETELRYRDIVTAIDNFKTAHPTIIAIQENKTSTLGITQKNAQEKTAAGYTALMAACASDDFALAKKLIDYGADIYAKDVYDRTALSCARSTTKIVDFIRNNSLDIKRALGSIHSAHTILERAVQQNNKELIQLILQHMPEVVESSSNVLSLSNDIAVIRLLSRYGISPPSNNVLELHIQQEVIIQHILASTPWSYAQRLTMSVGDVKEWMRDYADMTSLIDQETMKEIQACQDDTMKATELLADDRLLYTVYCAKVVRKMKEGEMSLSTKTLVSLIESKMYLEHGYAEQALDKLLGTSEVIDVHIASHRIELEHAMQPLLMTLYKSSHDERLLKFSKLFMQDSIATAPEKSGDYQVLLELTDKIITGKSDDLDKSIEELTTKAQAFGEDKEGVESAFAECLEEWTKNWSMNKHGVLHMGMFSGHNMLEYSDLNTPNTEIDAPHPQEEAVAERKQKY